MNYFDFIRSLTDTDLAYFLTEAGTCVECLKIAAVRTMKTTGREIPTAEHKKMEKIGDWETMYRNMVKPRDFFEKGDE